jgi:antitoxin MazE
VNGIYRLVESRYLHCRYKEASMKTRVQKWGDGLALRIPKSFAAETGLREDAAVELSVIEGRLIVEPVAQASPTLEDFLRGVTDQNLHGEWNTGPAVGREVW